MGVYPQVIHKGHKSQLGEKRSHSAIGPRTTDQGVVIKGWF